MNSWNGQETTFAVSTFKLLVKNQKWKVETGWGTLGVRQHQEMAKPPRQYFTMEGLRISRSRLRTIRLSLRKPSSLIPLKSITIIVSKYLTQKTQTKERSCNFCIQFPSGIPIERFRTSVNADLMLCLNKLWLWQHNCFSHADCETTVTSMKG